VGFGRHSIREKKNFFGGGAKKIEIGLGSLRFKALVF
jgi:hypothetical protein